MGMGEPLLNLRAVTAAARFINADLGIGARHITVSTVGVPNAIGMLARQLKEQSLQLTLAVSIHAPSQAVRQRIIPRFDPCREPCHVLTHLRGDTDAGGRTATKCRRIRCLFVEIRAAERHVWGSSWVSKGVGHRAGQLPTLLGDGDDGVREGAEAFRCCSAKAYPLDALLQDCQKFLEVTGRRVTFEYTLLAGVNDSPAQASTALSWPA